MKNPLRDRDLDAEHSVWRLRWRARWRPAALLVKTVKYKTKGAAACYNSGGRSRVRPARSVSSRQHFWQLVRHAANRNRSQRIGLLEAGMPSMQGCAGQGGRAARCCECSGPGDPVARGPAHFGQCRRRIVRRQTLLPMSVAERRLHQLGTACDVIAFV